jgi:hypothetical protein
MRWSALLVYITVVIPFSYHSPIDLSLAGLSSYLVTDAGCLSVLDIYSCKGTIGDPLV